MDGSEHVASIVKGSGRGSPRFSSRRLMHVASRPIAAVHKTVVAMAPWQRDPMQGLVFAAANAIMGFVCLVMHAMAPNIHNLVERTISPAVSLGSTVAFSGFWLSRYRGWGAHDVMERVWNLMAFLMYLVALGSCLDGMEPGEKAPKRTILVNKAVVLALAATVQLGTWTLGTMRRNLMDSTPVPPSKEETRL